MFEESYYIPKSIEEIERLVEQRVEESTILEFKSGLPDPTKNDDIGKDISAFANRQGGVLIYGISEDNGTAVGLNPIELRGASERIVSIARIIDGPVSVDIRPYIETSSGKGLMVVVVPASPKAPHVWKGSTWGRAGRTNTRLSRHEVGELFAKAEGFAEEFGAGPPGRIKLDVEKEFTTGNTTLRYNLVFSNDGRYGVKNAGWKWENPESVNFKVSTNPFPIEEMPPTASVRIACFLHPKALRHLSIITEWDDERRGPQEMKWPVVFY